MLIPTEKKRKAKREKVPNVEPEQQYCADEEKLPHPFASPVPLSKKNLIDST